MRWSPLGGLLWFVAYPIGFLIGTGSGDTASEVIERADSHELGIGIALIVVLISPLLLGWFVGGLYLRLRALGALTESIFALIGGAVFTVLLFVADTIVLAALSELGSADEAVQASYAQTILVLEDVSWNVQGGAGVATALMIIASSVGARRSIPRWTFWVSLALGIVSLNTIGFIGVFAWIVWVGAAAVVMLVTDHRRAPPR